MCIPSSFSPTMYVLWMIPTGIIFCTFSFCVSWKSLLYRDCFSCTLKSKVISSYSGFISSCDLKSKSLFIVVIFSMFDTTFSDDFISGTSTNFNKAFVIVFWSSSCSSSCFENFISILVGWTFTSTIVGSVSMFITTTGYLPIGRYVW